jgi:cell fate (sporulation/competence/biofilm development) regulator YlbF (YheA/YmcA/DUF963 family)
MAETHSTTRSAGRPEAEFVHDLASVLMAAPAYRGLVTAGDRMRADTAVADAIRAAEERQAQLQREEARGQVTPATRREVDHLWEEVERQPAVVAYREAERSLMEVCREVNRVVSEILGLDFAAHARRSCCGGGT